MSATTDALKRAKQRLGAHGWRQGPVSPKQFNGYSLHDAIVGKAGGEGTETEQRAIAAASEAARFLDHDTKDWPAEGFLEAWNDKPDRTREQVLTVITIAAGYAEAADSQAEAPRSEPPVQPTPDACPTPVQPDHDASDASDASPAPNVDIEVNSEPALTGVNTPEPEVSAPETKEPDPFDRDGDGHPGGSLPASQRGLEALVAEAAALGYEVDGRWGEKRLRQAIELAMLTDQQLADRALPPVEPIKPMPDPLRRPPPAD